MADMTPQEAAAAGLGWVDRNNPNYGKAGFVGSTPASGGTDPNQPAQPASPTPAAGGPTPSSPAGSTDSYNATTTAAQTYSPTPAAAPAANTTNQGSQDLYRNTLIQQMTQDATPDVNDPTIQAQLAPAQAAIERARRDEVNAGAEKAFAGGQDYTGTERLAASERAGQQSGLMAADLVGRELQARRSQISDALTKMGNTISDDQRRALEDKLQTLDATIRQKGLDVQRELGLGDLNLRGIGQQLQNQQFDKRLGFDIGSEQARLNAEALRSIL